MRKIYGILNRLSFPYGTVFFVIIGLILFREYIITRPFILVAILMMVLLILVLMGITLYFSDGFKKYKFAYLGNFTEETSRYIFKGDRLIKMSFNRSLDSVDSKDTRPWAPYWYFNTLFSDYTYLNSNKKAKIPIGTHMIEEIQRSGLVVNLDAKGVIKSISKDTLIAFEKDSEDVIGKHILMVPEIFGLNKSIWTNQIAKQYAAHSSAKTRFTSNEKCFFWSYESVLDRKGDVDFIIVLGHEITTLVQSNGKCEEHAHIDQLTGLLNQQGLYDTIDALETFNQAITFFIDIHDFSVVNDHFGHEVGDYILKMITEELKETAGSYAKISRFSGDKFVVLFTDDHLHHLPIKDIVSKFQKKLHSEFKYQDTTIRIEKNIGYAIYPEDSNELTKLIAYSSLAMKAAQQDKHHHIMQYRRIMSETLNKNFHLSNNLKIALENDSIEIHFQETIDMLTGNVRYLEQMSRWTDADFGIISPKELFMIAKESHQLDVLEKYLVKKSILYYQNIRQKPRYKQTKLSLNLNPESLLNSEFLSWLKALTDEVGINRGDICIEISEVTFVHKLKICVERIETLKQEGFIIALDDFGKEYSSLAILDHLKFDIVKLDGLFTASINKLEIQEIIKMIRNITKISHKELIVEGVETLEQSELLNELECFLQQGFYHHVPSKICQ